MVSFFLLRNSPRRNTINICVDCMILAFAFISRLDPSIAFYGSSIKKSCALSPRTMNSPKYLLSATSPIAEPISEVAMENPPSQILQFREPTTNVTVMLIGAMHYNPSSIKLTRETLENLSSRDKLGAVVIETCDLRWSSGNTTEQELRAMAKFLQNEMRTAYDVAIASKVPVVLGDQRINITATRMKEVAQQTLLDLVTPLQGGWDRFYSDVRDAWSVALPYNEDSSMPKYINARGFFDARLLMAMPVTLVKYPLSWIARAPIGTVIFLSILVGLDALADYTSVAAVDAAPIGDTIMDWIGSLAFVILEFALLGRILVRVLLAERNEVLADNILHQCRLLSKQKRTRNWWHLLFDKTPISKDETITYYATPPIPKTAEAGNLPKLTTKVKEVPRNKDLIVTKLSSANDPVVVAVLGMAHCNGIMKLLLELRK